MYMAYDRIDPFTRERTDHGVGLICSVIAQVFGSGKTYKPSDFMIDYDEPVKKKKSAKELQHLFGMFARAQNGKKR